MTYKTLIYGFQEESLNKEIAHPTIKESKVINEPYSLLEPKRLSKAGRLPIETSCSVRAFMVEDCQFMSEVLFIYLLVEKLVFESLKSPYFIILGACLLLLLRSEISAGVLLDTVH